MNDLGHFFLLLSFGLAVYGLISGVLAGKTRSEALFQTTINSTALSGVLSVASTVVLGLLFLRNEYGNQYVWQYSNRDMDAIYKFTAVWGGMDGSMLLWGGMLGVCAAIVAFRARLYPRQLMPWVLAVINSTSIFFLSIVVFLTNPFRYIQAPYIPPDGNGLNPLLQNAYMAIHPPMLYLGFTFLSIPYAFCLGALLANRANNEWIRLTRVWTLIAWGFLTIGITLGGYWAYIELGWGGFWAWDPVENASFLPWLTATAFLHSVMVQERKNMLRFWNIWLIVLSYGLTVFGTFLTRSGVVQSVHAFASTDIGWVFLLYLAIVFVLTCVLTFVRRVELRSERKIESLFSREAAFLMNNLVLLSICFATFWGVMFPVLSEAITGEKQAVGIPFFNAVNVPLFLLLIFLMGVGPLIAWKKASLKSLQKTFLTPALAGLVAGVALLFAGIESFYAILSYSLCFFVFLTILGEYHRGLRAQRSTSESQGLAADSIRLLKRHRIRYGSYLIHFGVLVATIGITASMAHKVEKEFSLGKEQSYSLGRYKISVLDVFEREAKNYMALVAKTELRDRKTNELITSLEPEMRYYKKNKESTTEVALHKSLLGDFYLVLGGLDDTGSRAAFKAFINPLQAWLWIGVVIMALGTLVVAIPVRTVRQESVLLNAQKESA